MALYIGPVKRIALAILGLGLLMVIGYYACVLVVTVMSFGKPPSWTYGEGRFTRFKRVAGHLECVELVALLEGEKPEEFNRRRKELGLEHRYLDLTHLRLVGKDLAGVDLSRCILTGCDFSGSNLRGASFRKSYVPQTTFCGPLSVQGGAITPKMARTTDLSGSHFDDATLEATVYAWVEASCIAIKCQPNGLAWCNLANSTRLPVLAPARTWDLPIKVTPSGPQVAPPTGRMVATVANASAPCDNPFRDVPDSALEQ